jgi:hypothetical protein
MKPKQQTEDLKSPVSTPALVARINRQLSKHEQTLRKNRSERWSRDLGRWYIVNLRFNHVASAHQSLDRLGREMGVLQPWERWAEE